MTITYMAAPVTGSRVSATATCTCGKPVWAFGDTRETARAEFTANLTAHIKRDHKQ